jgi:thiamine-phosphate pyrophosphorylase
MLSKKRFFAKKNDHLYVIIDPDFCVNDVLFTITESIRAGAGIIQLRVKEVSDYEYYRLSLKTAEICLKNGVLLLINDRADIALASGAQGVHLGNKDISLMQQGKYSRMR